MNLDTMGFNFNDLTLNYPKADGMNLVPCIPFTNVPGSNDKNYPNLTIAAVGTGATARFFIRSGSDSSGGAVWQELGVTAGGVATVPEGGTGAATLTNHGVLIGHGTSPVSGTSAGTTGQLLQSKGASADPDWTTATYPATATGTGTFLRANGTNWLASTATLPDTANQGDMLYASAANVWSSLAKSTSPGQVLTNGGTSNAPIWADAATGSGEGWTNLGIALSGGTLSIVGQDGSAISATNPAMVQIASQDTPGTIKTFALTTAPATMPEAVMNTATFGTTASTAWASAMPFFIYAVTDSSGGGTETNCTFMLSRNPKAKVTVPSASNGTTALSSLVACSLVATVAYA